MMDVVNADVSRKPLENPGQFIVGRPFEGSLDPVPLTLPRPVSWHEVVLHVKKPYPHDAGDPDGGKLDENVGFQSYRVTG